MFACCAGAFFNVSPRAARPTVDAFVLTCLREGNPGAEIASRAMRVLRRDFALQLSMLHQSEPSETVTADLRQLYQLALDYPLTSTRRHVAAEHGLTLNGPLFPERVLGLMCGMLNGKPVVAAPFDAHTAAVAKLLADHPPPREVPIVRCVVMRPYIVTPRYSCDVEHIPLQGPNAELVYLQRVAQSLAWLHTHHIAHNDVRAANMFANMEGEVFLGDFDAACEFGRIPQKFGLQVLPNWAAQRWGGRHPADGLPRAAAELDWVMLGVSFICRRVDGCDVHQEAADLIAAFVTACQREGPMEAGTAMAARLRVCLQGAPPPPPA